MMQMTGWHYLALGIVTEVIGTFSLKLSDGYSKLLPTALSITMFVIALGFVAMAMKTLDMSVAYAIWSAVGVVLITLLGYVFLGESLTWARVFFIALIVVGVIGLRMVA